jgi:periplasmic divalent cation tolerance protein
MKTRRDLFEELSERVKALHSYEVPEVLAFPIIKGLPSYLKWLGASLQPVKNCG